MTRHRNSRRSPNVHRAAPLLATLLALAACSSDSEGKGATSTAPAGAAPPAAPTAGASSPSSQVLAGGPYTITGEVVSFESGVIADAAIDLWVQTPTFGFSYWWANGPLRSDGLGQFVANVRGSDITILAHKTGFVQPCAVKLSVSDHRAVRLEMIPVSSLDSLDPVRPQLSTEPTLTGVIYETTPDGRQPIAGADLWAEHLLEVAQATTRSDRGGGYFLCNLGPATYLYVGKPGFETRYLGPIDASQSRVLDIELERTPSAATESTGG